ncbi:coiled-coil domain-containing protein 175 [Cetorhinus maximus]
MQQCPTQLPAVRVVLERLQDLEKKLKTKKVCFGRETVRHFAQVIEGVSQLEEVRRNIHDVLEVETIEASKLRHKLTQLPNILNQQIAVAVTAARELKATHLKELQSKIETMTQQIGTLEKEYSRLEKENASLCPIQQKAGALYDNLVSQLNEVMEKRTSDQITLNETHDNISVIQKKIILVDRKIVDLNKELSEEQSHFETQKAILTAKLTEMHLLVQDQNAANFEKKIKVDGLNAKLVKLNDDLSTQKDINELLQIQNTNLKKEEDNLQKTYNEESKIAEELIVRKQSIMGELITLIKNLRMKAEELRKSILQVAKDTEDVHVLNQGLFLKSESRHEAFKKAKKRETEVKQNFYSLDKRLEKVKYLLSKNEEQMSRIRKETQELEENIMSVVEKNKDTMDFLNGELLKYTHKFEKEQQLRETIQQRRDEISKEIMHIKASTEDYLTHLSMRMKALKKKRETLITEIKRLQKEINIYAEKTVALRKQRIEGKAAFSNIKELLSTEIKQMKNEIEEMNGTIKVVKEELQEKVSTQHTLESMLAEETAACDELLKEREDQINAKHNIDNTISQLKTKTAVLLSSKPELKALLSVIRSSLNQQVKNTAEQIKLMEADIYEASRRLEQVEMENCKLKLCNFQLAKAIASLNEGVGKQNAAKKQQETELQIIYGNLQKNWTLEANVHKEHAACEQSVLNVIEELMKKIYHREQKIGSISDQLKEYLSKLQSFVGTTSIEESKEICMIGQTKTLQ